MGNCSSDKSTKVVEPKGNNKPGEKGCGNCGKCKKCKCNCGKEDCVKCGSKPCIYWNRMSPPASATMCVAKMCAEGQFDCKEIDLMAGEHKKPEYLKVNPAGKVPAFKAGDFCIAESRAIMQMIVRKSGCEEKIMGKTIEQRAKCMQALFFESGTIAAKVIEIAHPVIWKKEEPNQEKIQAFLEGPCKEMDCMLSKCKFLGGDCMSIADISAIFHLGLLVMVCGDDIIMKLQCCENIKKWLCCSMGGCDKFCKAIQCMEEKCPGGQAKNVCKLMQSCGKIKLHYWPVKARAHMSRCLLHYKGIEFEDCHVTPEAWKESKPKLAEKLLYPNLPYMECGDCCITESVAILKCLARKCDLSPTCPKQCVMADQIAGFLGDAFDKMPKIKFGTPDPEEQKAAYKALCDGIEAQWGPLEKKLSDCKWLVGDCLSWVDFYAMAVVDVYCCWCPEFKKLCPNMCKLETQMREESASLDTYLTKCKLPQVSPPEW